MLNYNISFKVPPPFLEEDEIQSEKIEEKVSKTEHKRPEKRRTLSKESVKVDHVNKTGQKIHTVLFGQMLTFSL